MAPAISMALTGTGAAATSGNHLAVGETATFHASVILPSGRSQALRLDAAVPAGLSLVSETITYATPGTTGLWVGETSGSGFNLGTISSGSPVRVEYDIVARATAPANGSVQAVVSASDPAGGGGRVSAAQGTPVVALAPALSVQVNGPGQVQAGQSATYTVRLSNAAGAASAYGVTLADVLGAGLTLVPGTVQASGPAAGATVSSGSGSTLAVTTTRLDPGESLVLTLQAQGIGSMGAVLQSQARATAASLPGGNAAYQLAPVLASGAATLVAPTAGLTLSGLSARVGDVVILHITAWLPAGDNPAVRLVVHLPAGLGFVPASVQATRGAAPVVTADANGVAVSLGRVTAPAGGGAVSVDLQAVVGAAPVGAGLGCSAVVETGYAASAAAVATLQVADTAPVLAGLPSLTSMMDDASVAPLTSLTLADPDAGQVQSAQVVLSSAGDGLLTNLGGGQYDAALGRYQVSGAADAVQAALRGLVFVPTAHRLAFGAERATTLTVQVSDGAGGVAAAASGIIAQGTDTVTAIGGAVAGQVMTT
ncbi:MAG: isopeptide-forming domain-containing fimbrial protein, partial [Janthinobacterium lividum]